MPLSTLHARPYGRSYMTQGRCDWLGLHRTTLAFATPHRFIPALLPFILRPDLRTPCPARALARPPRSVVPTTNPPKSATNTFGAKPSSKLDGLTYMISPLLP